MASKKKESKSPVELAIENLEKQFKKKNIIKKASDRKDKVAEVIPFGIEELDRASFCGGIPRGKMVELFGPESSGKSYLSLKLIASAQKMGINCCLLDVEQSFDPIWAITHGVDLDKLYLVESELSGEEYMNYANQMIKTGEFGLIVVDSTAALMPSEEMDNEIGKNSVALLARLMSQACKKIMTNCGIHNATAVFVNQIRDKPGVMFGNPETTPGGRALKFYSHVRLSVYPGGYELENQIIDGEEQEVAVAKKASVTFIKNKVARPRGKAKITIQFEKDANNPLVFLAKTCKEVGFIKVYNKEFTINKVLIEGAKKNVPTGTISYVDLVHFLKKNNLIETLLEELMQKHDSGEIKLSSEIIKLSEDLEYLDSLEMPQISEEYKVKLSKMKSLAGGEDEGDEEDEESVEEEDRLEEDDNEFFEED